MIAALFFNFHKLPNGCILQTGSARGLTNSLVDTSLIQGVLHSQYNNIQAISLYNYAESDSVVKDGSLCLWLHEKITLFCLFRHQCSCSPLIIYISQDCIILTVCLQFNDTHDFS